MSFLSLLVSWAILIGIGMAVSNPGGKIGPESKEEEEEEFFGLVIDLFDVTGLFDVRIREFWCDWEGEFDLDLVTGDETCLWFEDEKVFFNSGT